MIRSHSVVVSTPQSTPATRALQTPAALRNKPRPQMRRYRVMSQAANGDIDEVQHIAPALPLFEDPFCAFARGSMVETESGPMAIEDLLPGDRVMTREGVQTVRWIGSTIIVPGHPSHRVRKMNLTRIMADSFGFGRPASCLITGPSARLLGRPNHMRAIPDGNELATPVQSFVDGMSVIETSPPTSVELFHMCLERHAVIRVNGMEFETYHPGNDARTRISATLRPLFLNLFPHIDRLEQFGLLATPRAGEAIDAI